MAGDPCAALFGSMKQACEATGKAVNGSGGGSTSILNGLLGYNSGFDFRHFMIRVAEFGIGAMLVIIAADALIKAEVMPNPIVQSTKRLGKKAFK
jgi:hypothetical protein